MYLEFYKLKEKPFSLTPDPSFLYYSNAHKRAIAFLRYGLQESKGFLQLTGPVGSGKTTLLRAVLAQLDEKTKTAYIINPCASFPELLRAVMKDLEISNIPADASKMELLDFFHDYLLGQVRRNNSVIIIFDESQNLSLKNLEEIRMLSNFETSKEKLIQIVFVGQSEFKKTIDLPELRQLRQRIQVRYHLSPLKPAEIHAYINHRLRVAGSDGTVQFAEDACTKLYEFSGGIPRLINAVCDVVLLIGYVNETKTFGIGDIQEAINELEGKFDEASPVGDELSHAGADDAGHIIDNSCEEYSIDNPDSEPISEPLATVEMHEEKEQPSAESQSKPVPSFRQKNGNGHDNNHSAELSHTVIGGMRRIATASPDRAQGYQKAEDIPEPPNEPSDTKPIPLHSFLRHQTTRRFKAAGSGLIKPDTRASMKTRLRRFVSEYIMPRNTASFHTRQIPHPAADKSDPEFEPIEKSYKKEPSAEKHHSQVAVLPGGAASHSPEWPHNNSIKHSPGVRLGGKVMVTFKDGNTLKGTVVDLPLRENSFHMATMEATKNDGELSIPFERVVTIRFTDTFLERPARHRQATRRAPSGHQIIVALITGEIIEGIILNSETLMNPRFLMMSSYGNKVVRIVVEKSGILGIMTKDLREGIYNEDFESMPEVFEDDGTPLSAGESRADFFFAASDFASAAAENQFALTTYPKSQRLLAKTSISYFNLGVHYLHKNQLASAYRAFENVPKGSTLSTRASTMMKSLQNFASGNSDHQGTNELIPE